MGCKHGYVGMNQTMLGVTGIPPAGCAIAYKLKIKNWTNREKEIAARTSTDPVFLHVLSQSKSGHVRFGVAENSSTCPDTLDVLADDPESYVRERVARNIATKTETLERMSKDPSSDVVYCVAKRYKNDGKDLSQFVPMAKDNSEIADIFASAETLPKGLARKMALDGVDEMRRNLTLTPSDLKAIYNAQGVNVAATLLDKQPREKFDDAFLERIHHDALKLPTSDKQRAIILFNLSKLKNIPANIQNSLVVESVNSEELVAVAYSLAHNGVLTSEEGELLQQHPAPLVQDAVWGNSSGTSKADIIQAYADGSHQIQAGIMKNPNTPPEIRRELLLSSHESLLAEIAVHSNVPMEDSTSRLIAENYPYQRSDLIKRDDCPQSVVNQVAIHFIDDIENRGDEVWDTYGLGHDALAKTDMPSIIDSGVASASYQFRARIAENKNLVPAQVEILANDKTSSVRQAVASRSDLTSKQVDSALSDKSARVRIVAVDNPHIPVETILKFFDKENDPVVLDRLWQRINKHQQGDG